MKCEEAYCRHWQWSGGHVQYHVCTGEIGDRRICPRALRRENERLKRLIVVYDDDSFGVDNQIDLREQANIMVRGVADWKIEKLLEAQAFAEAACLKAKARKEGA